MERVLAGLMIYVKTHSKVTLEIFCESLEILRSNRIVVYFSKPFLSIYYTWNKIPVSNYYKYSSQTSVLSREDFINGFVCQTQGVYL